MAVGAGATERIQRQIASLGSDVIVVIPGSITTSGIRLGSGNALTLTEDDARAITGQCPSVGAVRLWFARDSKSSLEAATGPRRCRALRPEYLTVRQLGMERGLPFTSKDVESANKVALLGKTVAD